MPLADLSPTDTRGLFRPVSTECVALLRTLTPADWDRPTVAGRWVVRDVLAHLLDVTLRRLSFHRDQMAPPPPSRPINAERDFVDFINELNAQWVGATRRLSPRVLTDQFARASTELADWFESVPFEAPALFPVSWAGEQASPGWFDIGREFTELWHHQQQIRMAVGAASLADPRYLAAVIAVSMRALPHAYRQQEAPPGEALVLDVSGPSGGVWTLTRETERWVLAAGEPAYATARVRLGDDVAWKLFHNALSPDEALTQVEIKGRTSLADPLLRARAIVV